MKIFLLPQLEGYFISVSSGREVVSSLQKVDSLLF